MELQPGPLSFQILPPVCSISLCSLIPRTDLPSLRFHLLMTRWFLFLSSGPSPTPFFNSLCSTSAQTQYLWDTPVTLPLWEVPLWPMNTGAHRPKVSGNTKVKVITRRMKSWKEDSQLCSLFLWWLKLPRISTCMTRGHLHFVYSSCKQLTGYQCASVLGWQG